MLALWARLRRSCWFAAKVPALLGRAIVTAAGSYKDVGPLGQAAAQQLQRLLVCYKVAIYALPAIYP